MDAAIVAEAQSWVGTPFRHGAALKGVGVDCIHLVQAVFRAVGLTEAEVPAYPPDWHLNAGGGDLLRAGLLAHCDPVDAPYQVGDILVYNFGRAPSHCGIYVGDGRVVHAVTLDQVQCDRVASPSLAKRFVGAYRIRRS